MEFALYDSQNENYKKPFGAVKKGTDIKISIETEVFSEVILNVIYFDGTMDTEVMTYEDVGEEGYIYTCILSTSHTVGILKYYFSITNKNHKFFYGNNDKALGGLGKVYDNNPIPYQITVYEEQYIPNWYKEGIIYQIFVDRFYNGNKDGKINNPKKNSFIYGNWNDSPMYIKSNDGSIARWDFFGGNLKGVIDKIPYLKELGITIIYMNPIFEAFSCHKYDTGDYEKVDPMFGTNDDFKDLCRIAKENNIRIILDGVFNHTGANSKYFNKYGEYDCLGAYQSKESPYYKWYSFKKHPNDYDSWWGDRNLPAVNELDPSYIDYMITGKDSIITKWIKMGASGWRLDVADELPDEFIKLIKENMRKEDTQSVLIGEVWEDASNKISYGKKRQYVFGDELDSVINYPLRNSIIQFINGNITAVECKMRIMSIKENYPENIFYSTMNILGNHDTERIFTLLGEDKKKLELTLLMMITMPGVPLIYYGDEAGLTGYKDPDNRRTYPWGHEDLSIMNLYKKMIRFRKDNEILINGQLEIYAVSDEILAYKRTFNNKHILVIINSSNKEVCINIDTNFHYSYMFKDTKDIVIRGKGYFIKQM